MIIQRIRVIALTKSNIAIALLFALLVHFPLLAQQDLTFTNYSVDDGLSSNTVWDIKQDDFGFMWFATKNGLTRFDGYNFKTYQYSDNYHEGLGNNLIHSILKVEHNFLWLGTENGIFIFNLKEELFSHFPYLKDEIIYDLKEDDTGKIWIATSNKGVLKFDPSNDKITIFDSNKSKSRLSSNEVRELLIASDGKIWVGTFQTGIDIIDPVDNSIYNLEINNSELGSNSIFSIYQDRKSNIWVGTFGGGLNLWLPAEGKFKTFNKQSSNINSNIVRSIYQDEERRLLIGTEQGLNILDLESEQFTHYTYSTDDSRGISDNAIYSIFEDNNEGVWFGTYFGGVDYSQMGTTFFDYYYPTNASNTLNGRAVSSFLEDESGNFWIGTEDGGLSYFDAKLGTFQNYPFKEGQELLSYHNIHSLYKDKKGRIWIGTFSGGLNIYDKSTGKVKIYKNEANDSSTLPGNNVFCIYEDRGGTIWVGTTAGLCTYDRKTDSFVSVGEMNMDKTFVRSIYEDDTGTIWFATYGEGLIGKKLATNKWKYFNLDGEFDDLGPIITLEDDHAGNLWLGTEEHGLVKFNIADESFKIYNKEYGIDANSVYGILQDSERTLWLSTNNGLYNFNPQKRKAVHYNDGDNLQSYQFNYNACYKAADGRMFFGGIKGFNTFYPNRISKDSIKGNIVWTNFQLFNKDVSVGKNHSILTEAINYTDEINLSHNQSTLSIEYASLNFSNATKVKYAYRMEGFEEGWNYVDHQRKATYTNLSPGNYKFIVKATTNDENWDVPHKALTISISPPFYQTAFAYMFYILILIALFLWGKSTVVERTARKNKIRLERLSIQQEKEFYNQKIDFFTTMAHEIRTPLSLIMAPLEKLKDSKNLSQFVDSQLSLMSKNTDRLLNLVNQLLDFRRIESDVYEIHKEKLNLVIFLQSMFSKFSAMEYQYDVRFSMNTKLSNLNAMADSEALTKIFNNILINAFKFASTKVILSIKEPFEDENGNHYALTTIEDDGPGIPKEELGNIFRKYFKVTNKDSPYSNLIGTGIGLSLAKSLIEKHGGYLEVESKPNVSTVFNIFLPCLGNTKEIRTKKVLPIENQPSIIEKDESSVSEVILIVEDDTALLKFIEQSLSEDGYDVLTARNGSEALDALETQDCSLIISDIMMPVMNGLDFCQTVKNSQSFCHLPLVLLTAKTNSQAEILGLQYGADAYISKPFIWKHVRAVVNNLLRSRAILKEKFASQPFTTAETLTTHVGGKKFLEKITKLIEEKIKDPTLSVTELSRELGMSRSSLHKKLKSISGKVPNEFIRLLKLKHAAKLLYQNEYNISQIGYMSGFNSPSYFSKCFFDQFKTTPSEFLEKQKSIEVKRFNNSKS